MFARLFAVVLLAATAAAGFAQSLPHRPLPPRPLLVIPDGELPIRLHSLNIRADISGGMAETTVRMVFYNPNGRMLEGELQFPLLAGQQITAFALDIDGKLRPAVPVEKAKGRRIFESIERRQADPALLEQTEGNNFKLRVYPIPAMGTRTVELKYAEALERSGTRWSYRLPLRYTPKPGNIDLAFKVHGSSAAPKVSGATGTVKIARQDGSYLVRVPRSSFSPTGMLNIQVPANPQPQTYVQEHDGETYFLTEFPVATARTPRKLPGIVGLLWDSSGSGANRPHETELAVLDRYFSAIGNAEVRVTRLRDRPEAVEVFRVVNGQWNELRKALENTVYDGASALADWTPQADVNEYVMVSDGLLNYGNNRFPSLTEGQRLYVLGTALIADATRMSSLAERNGGRFIPVQQQQPTEAASALLSDGALVQLQRASGASDVQIQASDTQQGLLRIAGKLTQATAELDLVVTEQGHARNVRIAIPAAAPAHPLAAYLWASYRLHALEADFEANRGAIRRLGTQFSVPTRETSLIVLDELADYVRYDVTPPAEFLATYEQLRATHGAQLAERRHNHLERIVREFEQKVSWWEKTYPKDAPAQKDLNRHAYPVGVPAPAPTGVPARLGAPSPTRNESSAQRRQAAAASADGASSDTIGITLKKWTSDAPYIARMQAAGADTLYQVYLDEKPSYANSSAFFLDAADMLFDKGQRDLALRVLSNLAELDLENRHVLRILAYRLLQAESPELAIPVFEKVKYLAEEEPQSFRDLALAYHAAKQYQPAIDHLNEVVIRPWDNRFAEIELIALAEMNAIVATAPATASLDTSRIDPRLLKNLPLDLRAVLTWDADNSDMDLWITDPNGEKCYYGNRFTYQGGRLSRDFTGGYGPEEFSLRDAKPGKYKIEVNFYGHRQQLVSGATTLQVKLSSGFGTGQLVEKMMTLRLKGQGQTVFVGEFEVKPK